jgi:hypothetical protein
MRGILDFGGGVLSPLVRRPIVTYEQHRFIRFDSKIFRTSPTSVPRVGGENMRTTSTHRHVICFPHINTSQRRQQSDRNNHSLFPQLCREPIEASLESIATSIFVQVDKLQYPSSADSIPFDPVLIARAVFHFILQSILAI